MHVRPNYPVRGVSPQVFVRSAYIVRHIHNGTAIRVIDGTRTSQQNALPARVTLSSGLIGESVARDPENAIAGRTV